MLQDKMALKKQTNNGWMELYLKPPFILQKIVFTFTYFENWLSGSIPGLKLIVMVPFQQNTKLLSSSQGLVEHRWRALFRIR